MLLTIIAKCVITEIIMTIVIFAIDIISRKLYKTYGRNEDTAVQGRG